MYDVEEILNSMKVKPTSKDKKLIERAHVFAEIAHQEQLRDSGEPYFSHAFAVGKTLAEFGLDPITIAAGLLHDVPEDTKVTEKEVEKRFGKKIKFLVHGVTKLGRFKYKGNKRYAHSLQKLLIASAKDVRVLIIKLVDRLHNVQTLQYKSPEKAKKIAVETISIYEPIAYRLGMGKLMDEMQDLTFKYADPHHYKMIEEIYKARKKKDKKILEKVWRKLKREMALNDIKEIKTYYRVKNMYSLWKKLQKHDMDIEKIHDIVALRVIVPAKEDCYKALGLVHTLWRPLPGLIKDYIASPKINGYQSLHTTIFTGDGGIAEIQIRTPQMHKYSEYGFAAHFIYKDKAKDDFRIIEEIQHLEKEELNPKDFLKAMETGILKDRIFVFTPHGDVMDLPEGSTPIDFAFHVHTDLGKHISGALVNGKNVSIKTPLKQGDIVEIKTKRDKKPNRKWLKYINTIHAKRQIESFLKKASHRK